MITPMTSIQIPWHIAKLTRMAMAPTITVMQSIGIFWTVWAEIYGANK